MTGVQTCALPISVFTDGEAHAVETEGGTDERVRRVAVHLTPEFDASGQVETLLVVSQDITARHEYQQALAHAATHDALTGLPNRAMFDALIEAATLAIAEGHGPVSVLFIDLDAFKDVNDSLGHLAGDALLVGVAGRLRATVPAGGALARLGGDEFGLLLTGRDEVAATAVASELLDVLTEPLDVTGNHLIVSASIGIAVAHDADSVGDLLRWSDIAMYRAKRVRRSGYAVYDRALSDEVKERLRTDQWLRRALDLDEITVAYQPIVDLRSGEVLGVEALVRWTPGRRDEVVASDFVPIAEENGTIVPIGRAVLDEACRTVAGWRRDGLVAPDFTVSVNVSARQLAGDGLAADVDAALAASGLPPESLCLEVTETSLIRDLDVAASVLSQIRRRGVRVAIDDFGTGYGSLGLLQQLPVDQLKVDRSFVSRLGEDRDAEVIASTVTALANGLGLDLVAEGVETPEQRDRLLAVGCGRGQGFLFARPASAAEFVAGLGAG